MNNNNDNECLFLFFRATTSLPSCWTEVAGPAAEQSRAAQSTRIEKYICGRKLKKYCWEQDLSRRKKERKKKVL